MEFTRLRQRSALLLVGLCISLMLGGGAAFAQITTGEILGTVKDPSGAVIPGANVILHNEQTGATLSTTTNGTGLYYFTPILIGRYDVTVSKTGFATVTHSNITVQLQASVMVNFTLTAGKVTTLVQVSAAPPQLQTTNESTGGVVTSTEVNDLPLETRNYTFLAGLMPGVTELDLTGGNRVGYTGGYTANGMNSEWNSYLLDGVDNNNNQTAFQSGAAYVALPPPDALSEFQVQTSDFGAQYGRAGGGIMMAEIKSGTNQYHGDVWEYNQNNAYDANGFFENASHTTVPKLAYNQFGFTFGGPVVIPHIYNGHDHTFFFADYQGTRIAEANFFQDTVPTEAEIGSGYTDFQDTYPETTEDYNDILGRTFPGAAIMDPATTRYLTAGEVDPVTGLTATQSGYVRDPFYLGSLVGVTNFTGAAQEALLNQLPASRLDPNAIKILGLFPAPNTAGILGGTEDNYAVTFPEPETDNHFDIRVDEDFSPKDQMNAAITYDKEYELAPASINSGYGDNGTSADSTFVVSSELSETHIFSPTFINEILLGYNRDNTPNEPYLGKDNVPGIPAMFGIQGISQAPGNYGLPGIDVSGLTDLGLGLYTPVIMDSNTTDIQDNVTKIYGKHTFKGGFQTQFLYYPYYNPFAPHGVFSFGDYTGIWNQTGSYPSQGMADILLKPEPATVPGGINYDGGPSGVSDSSSPVFDLTRHYYAPWFQDTFKATPQLTLTMGLRWEYEGGVNDRWGLESNFTPGTYCGLNKYCGAVFYISSREKNVQLAPSFEQLMAKDGVAIEYKNTPILNTPLGDWAPHFGAAWEVTPKLVARAGYGIFYGGFITNGSNDPAYNYPANVQRSNPPTATSASPIVYSNGAYATLEEGLLGMEPTPNAAGFSAEGLGLYAFEYPWKDTSAQQWNAALQYQLTPNQTITFGYMGTHVTHIFSYSSWTNNPTEVVPPGTSLTNGCAVTDSIDSSCVPFPDFGVSFNGDNGDSHYESAYIKFQRRFSQGLQTLMDYTYAECMGNDYPALGDGDYSSIVRYPTITGFGGIRPDNEWCDDDAPNVFHGAVDWTLPFGRGQRFGRNMPKALNLIAGGWQANAIVTMQNGYPYTIGCAGPATVGNGSNAGCQALEVPGQNLYAGQSLPGHFLNINAFHTPPVDTAFQDSDFAPLGGQGGQIHGPTYDNVDFSMFKNFQITESKSLQFRAEFFNFFNTPQWETGAFYNTNYLSPPEFGAISATVPQPLTGLATGRLIQFALKFFF
jgi:Carboxypeptidase regulatory-like domain/TonB-dependent Receptor Plug Domain